MDSIITKAVEIKSRYRLTYAEIAEEVGLSVASVQRIFKGGNMLPITRKVFQGWVKEWSTEEDHQTNISKDRSGAG